MRQPTPAAFRAAACSFALASLLAAGAAQAGGVAGGKLRHQRCLQAECKVEVTAVRPSTGNNCRVRVPDVVFLLGSVDRIVWEIQPGGAAPTHRFAARRVAIDDNDTADDSTPSGLRNFDDEGLDAARQADRKRLVAEGSRRWKVFTYTLHLQWLGADGVTWNACAPHDPIIVNRGQ
jgi:hypothetical protein